MQISENGVVSFREAFPDAFPRQLPLPTGLETPTPALIAGFWGYINVRKNGGAIFFIEMDSSNENRFGESKARVLNHLRNGFGNTMEDFDPTHIFLVTWEAVHQNDPGIAQRVSLNLREVHVYSIYLQSQMCKCLRDWWANCMPQSLGPCLLDPEGMAYQQPYMTRILRGVLPPLTNY